MEWPGLYNYWIAIFLMMAGLYIVMAHANLVKKMVGLSVFQASVFILYITGQSSILSSGWYPSC